MARVTQDSGTPTARTGLRAELLQIGRRWSVSLTKLVTTGAELDESGEWALDGSPTCAHWLAAALDVEVCTAREWLRIGRALRKLPRAGAAFTEGSLPYAKARTLTRIATPDNEADLLDIADQTPAGKLGAVLAAWSARNEDEGERERRHRRQRSMRWQTQPDGMVTATISMTPEQAATVTAAIDATVMRSDGRDLDASPDAATERGMHASGTRESHAKWLSLAQQRVDALVDLIGRGGTNTTVEVILHVRADGCTLDDGTPIAGSIVERIASAAALRAMIHDAEGHPVNVSGRHRHHTARQKRVVKERDRECVDCGATDFLEYDHVPDFHTTGQTLVEETELRCSRCHAQRHAMERRRR